MLFLFVNICVYPSHTYIFLFSSPIKHDYSLRNICTLFAKISSIHIEEFFFLGLWYTRRWLGRESTNIVKWSSRSFRLKCSKCRYHSGCRLKFMARRNVLYASRKTSYQDLASVDEANETVKSLLDNGWKSMWTSIEVEKIYQQHGGSRLSR